MRGRGQALFVALAGSASVVFCWISAAAVALVTLRRGAGEGAWLLLWALLPAVVVAWQFGDSSYIVLFAGTLALALVLRASVSLPLTLLGSVPVGLVAGLVVLAFGDAYLEQVRSSVIEPYMTYLEQQLSRGGEPVTLPRPAASAIAGMIGVGSAVMAVLCLLLARYWQAALYNPGGFGEEFRSLRFPVWAHPGARVARVGRVQRRAAMAHLGHGLHGATDLCRTGSGPRPGAGQELECRRCGPVLRGLGAYRHGAIAGDRVGDRRQLAGSAPALGRTGERRDESARSRRRRGRTQIVESG
ncbi:MAG: hypothetical protein U5K56_08535 [Halioglobus sp.]|nr:hypothetical protein [Halioglobus sp.]